MKEEQAVYRQIFDTEIFEGALTLHKYPWHFHDGYTVVIVDSGAMKYVFRDGTITVSEHQAFIINPFVAHYNGVLDKESCNYKVMFLPVRLFNSPNNKNSVVHFDKAVNAEMYSALGDLFEKLKFVKEEREYTVIINGIAVLLLANLNHKPFTAAATDRVEAALQYIRQHLDEKLTIAQLADACNLSHFHFQRVFKKSVGLTVNTYIQQCRMELGRELLRKGLSPVFTSLESGFFDQSHFYKQFKKMYALTPAHLK